MAIYNTSGTVVAEYEYDAWGRVLSATDKTDLAIAEINPFRYRSYYYDTETELYYLETRYYDPKLGRFLNPDTLDYLGDGEDLNNYNLFAYCGNNPVMRADKSGHAWYNVLGWIGVGFVAMAAIALTCGAAGIAVGSAGFLGTVIHSVAVGTLYGAGAGVLLGAAAGIGYAACTGENLGSSIWAGIQAGFGIGAIAGAIFGGIFGLNSLTTVDINKFSNYVFDSAKSSGKNAVFEKIGYTKADAKALVKIYKRKALKQLITKQYRLAELSQYGQKITMGINLRGTTLKTVWMLSEKGIRLITPFTGYFKER